MNLSEVVSTFIAAPLNLQVAQMGTPEQPIPLGTARPYIAIRNEKFIDVMEHAVSDAATGDGGIASNMQDLNSFIEALFSGTLCSTQSLNQMISVFEDNGKDGYGLGIEPFIFDEGIAYGHTGNTSAYNTLLFYFPNQQVTLSFGFNGASEQDNIGKKLTDTYKRFSEVIFK